jgi:hypothetical protein
MHDEHRIEEHLRQAVERRGGVCKKIRFIGERGCPDRLVGLGGALRLVELKAGRRGVLSRQQRRFHEQCREAGIPVAVLRSVEEVDAWLTSVCDVLTTLANR